MMNLFILFLSVSIVYSANWPQPEFETCEYYQKLDEQLGCSEKGFTYLRDYATVYCKKFKKRSLSWSFKEADWTKKTGICLQEMLRDNFPQRLPSCRQLEEFAFDTHPICYKQYGICDLPITSQFKILNTVRFVDFLNRRSLGQVLNVSLKCLQKMISPDEQILTQELNLVSHELKEDEKIRAAQILLMAPVTSDQHRKIYFSSALQKFKTVKKL